MYWMQTAAHDSSATNFLDIKTNKAGFGYILNKTKWNKCGMTKSKVLKNCFRIQFTSIRPLLHKIDSKNTSSAARRGIEDFSVYYTWKKLSDCYFHSFHDAVIWGIRMIKLRSSAVIDLLKMSKHLITQQIIELAIGHLTIVPHRLICRGGFKWYVW